MQDKRQKIKTQRRKQKKGNKALSKKANTDISLLYKKKISSQGQQLGQILVHRSIIKEDMAAK